MLLTLHEVNHDLLFEVEVSFFVLISSFYSIFHSENPYCHVILFHVHFSPNQLTNFHLLCILNSNERKDDGL